MKSCRCVFACLLFSAASSFAQVPSLINYQGRLVNGTNLYNGTTTMVFRLYGSLLLPDVVFTDTQTVSVVDGLYSTRFGGVSLADALTNQPLFLEVQVGSTVMSPRERVAAVAYAVVANGVGTGGITSDMLANNSVTSNKIVTGAVGNSELAAGAVDTDEIVDGAVTWWKL